MKRARDIEHSFVSKQFHDCVIFFIMDLVNHFVYSVVLYLPAHNESFHEIGMVEQKIWESVGMCS